MRLRRWDEREVRRRKTDHRIHARVDKRGKQEYSQTQTSKQNKDDTQRHHQ